MINVRSTYNCERKVCWGVQTNSFENLYRSIICNTVQIYQLQNFCIGGRRLIVHEKRLTIGVINLNLHDFGHWCDDGGDACKQIAAISREGINLHAK